MQDRYADADLFTVNHKNTFLSLVISLLMPDDILRIHPFVYNYIIALIQRRLQ